jgi:transcriptional regulator with XRE-family HTH domain
VLKRSVRLRKAVEAGGGNQKVARRSGIPVATLNNYLGGRDLKAQAMIALADATNVRFEWLAKGLGPMRQDDPTPSEPAPQRPSSLTVVDVSSLAAGLGIAEELQPEAPPEARISAAFKAAAELRRITRTGQLPPLDLATLTPAFIWAEQVLGRDRDAHQRLALALDAYSLALEAARRR